MKKISVIVPCYNCAAHIHKCMDSLINQTIGMEAMEVILIDDCSTDQTLEILIEYKGKYPQSIIVIALPENMRQGGARNVGLQYASGKYIAYLDADDWMNVQAYEKIYQAAEREQADIVEFLNLDVYSKEEVPCIKSTLENELIILDTIQKRKEYIIEEKSTLGCWNKVYRADLLKGINAKYASGYVFEEPAFTYPIRFYEKRHYFLNEYLHYCFQNPEGTCRKISWDEARKYDHVIVQFGLLMDLISRGLLADYYEEIEYYFVFSYFIESIYLIGFRGQKVDCDALEEMQETVKKYFPGYKDNKYFELDINVNIKEMLKLIEIKADESNVEEYNALWKDIMGKLRRDKVE